MKKCESCKREVNNLFLIRVIKKGKRITVLVCSRCEQEIPVIPRPK